MNCATLMLNLSLPETSGACYTMPLWLIICCWFFGCTGNTMFKKKGPQRLSLRIWTTCRLVAGLWQDAACMRAARCALVCRALSLNETDRGGLVQFRQTNYICSYSLCWILGGMVATGNSHECLKLTLGVKLWQKPTFPQSDIEIYHGTRRRRRRRQPDQQTFALQ